MKLDCLKATQSIGGFKLIQEGYPTDSDYIFIHHESNSITFRLQRGPIRESGVNGCQIDTLIEAAKILLIEMNKRSRCRQNSLAITKLDEALHWLIHRKMKLDRLNPILMHLEYHDEDE